MAMRMRRGDLWVVYRMAVRGSDAGVNAVCTQAEWDEIEQNRPGVHALLRDRIGTESEAERLARGTSGDAVPRGSPRTAPGPAAVPAR